MRRQAHIFRNKKMASGKAKTVTKPKSKTRSARAGLQFPVGRVHRLLRKGNYAERVAPAAAVYLAAVMEYLSAEVLDLAARATWFYPRVQVTPTTINRVIRADGELSQLFNGHIPFSENENEPPKEIHVKKINFKVKK